MFPVGFGKVRLSINGGRSLLSGAMTPQTKDIFVSLAIINLTTNMMDIELNLEVANRSLLFSNGQSAYTFPVNGFVMSKWFSFSIALNHAGSRWAGLETVYCSSYRQRPTTAPSWEPKVFITSGNYDTIVVG